MNIRSHKAAFIYIAAFMIALMMTLIFSQQAVEIYAYGFIAQSINTKTLALEASKQHTEMQINSYKAENQKVIKNKATKSNKKLLTTSIVYKKETTNVNNFVLKKPVEGGITTSGFGDTALRSAGHKGHDWAVETGTQVRAAADGIVEMAYYSESYGYNVLINHNNGFKTRYAHLSELKVRRGERVDNNQVIALSGSTGYSTGPHLHFEVEKNGKKVNPLKYITVR